MNFLERVNAVLHHERPDKVPFAPSENLIPRGDFEREMRNMGMGLYTKRAMYWSETPDVRTESERQLDTVLAIVQNMVFHPDYSVYSNAVRDLGTGGIVRGTGIKSPLEEAMKYVGSANLEREQNANPELFVELLKALEAKTEELLKIVIDSPAEFISVGEINESMTPELFREYSLPFYQKFIPRLREAGKICSLDIQTSALKPFMDLIPHTGTEIVEGFRPPPVGDTSIQEAREAWGKDIIIWLDFLETVLLEGAEKTKKYATDLLKNDALIIGLINMKPVTGEALEHNFKSGLRAIMEASLEYQI